MESTNLIRILLFKFSIHYVSNFKIEYCEPTIHINNYKHVSLMLFCQSSDTYDKCVIGREINSYIQQNCVFSKISYQNIRKMFLKKETCTHDTFLLQIGYYGILQSNLNCMIKILNVKNSGEFI